MPIFRRMWHLAAAFRRRCRAQSMLARVSCRVVESIAKMPRFIRKRNPVCLRYAVKLGQILPA